MKTVVIVSGGMDSVTLLHQAVKDFGPDNVIALTFDYGSKHNKFEIEKATTNCKKLGIKQKIMNLRPVFDHFDSALLDHEDSEAIPEGHYEDRSMQKTVVPFRNGIMLSVAAGYAESIKANQVYYGAHAGDHAIYPDCTPEFIKSMDSVMFDGTYQRLQLVAPYETYDKTGILSDGFELGVDYKETHTCYNPDKEGRACGKCGSCIERIEAFCWQKKEDPVYGNRWEEVKEAAIKVLSTQKS